MNLIDGRTRIAEVTENKKAADFSAAFFLTH
jgi:hypothetical protein